MLNRLQAAARLLIRASLALFTAVVLLLIQSAFWSNRVSAWMQVIIVATALLSYFRPQYGLLALAVLAPLGQVGSRTLDSQMRGAEALVLAFLAGALMRGWTLREFRTFPSTRLEIAALIFAFVVAASCLEQIWLLQIQRDFPWEFAQQLFAYASRNYLTGYHTFEPIFRAMLLLEGLALMVYAARSTQPGSPFARYVVVMIVTGAVGTALMTIFDVAVEVFASPQTTFIGFITARRWTVHVGDVNAAGSFFAMSAFMAGGMCATDRARRFTWIAAATVIAIALLLTGSRTAVAAAGIVAVAVVAWLGLAHGTYLRRGVLAAIGLIIIAGGMFLVSREPGATSSQALTIRWLFIEITGRMLATEPLFGMGVGQYRLWSAQFASPELLAIFQPDNAHNNFAQIAGELGIAGILAFLAVLLTALGVPRASGDLVAWRTPILLGVAAFVLTWLGGHPLLVPEVAYLFWLALGAAAATTEVRVPTVREVVIASAILLCFTVPFRVARHAMRIDLSRVEYGVSARNIMTSRARFFVPASERSVQFPLRARGASDSDPVDIEVFVDGSISQSITITNRSWQRARIDLSGHASGRYRQIDLHIKPPAVDDVDTRPPVEVGSWEIISKPNG